MLRHLPLLSATAALLAACSMPSRQPQPAAPAPAPVAAVTVASYAATNPLLPTLARLTAAAGAEDPRSGTGPFTVFAPTDAAFGRLAPGTVDALVRPENKAMLVRLLGFHTVAGALTAADLTARVAAAGGTATLPTIAGEPLTLTVTEGHLTLTDGDGNRSYVEAGDLRQANGVVHVVNGVLVPKGQ